jgi:hypothetical protein
MDKKEKRVFEKEKETGVFDKKRVELAECKDADSETVDAVCRYIG